MYIDISKFTGKISWAYNRIKASNFRHTFYIPVGFMLMELMWISTPNMHPSMIIFHSCAYLAQSCLLMACIRWIFFTETPEESWKRIEERLRNNLTRSE